MQIDNKLLNKWVNYLEVAVTVFWMLFFMDINLPHTLSSLLKAISYPIVLILVLIRWKRIPYAVSREPFLILFIITATLSFLWTADLSSTLDGIRGLLRTVLLAAYIASRYSLKDQMKLWTWVFSLILILSVLAIVFLPGYAAGNNGAWQGIFPYKNFLGYTMSLAAVLFLNYIISNKRNNNLLAMFGATGAIALVVLAKSSASLVSVCVLLFGLPLYIFIKQKYKLRTLLIGFFFTIVCGITISVITNMDTILVDILGEGLSFNGRTPIWDLAISKGLEKALLGYGFNAFWNSDAGMYVMLNTWSGLRQDGFNTHNAFLELFLSLGFTGLMLNMFQLINVFYRIVIVLLKTKQIQVFWLLQLQIFTIIVSLGDSYNIGLLSTTIALTIGLEWSRIKNDYYILYST